MMTWQQQEHAVEMRARLRSKRRCFICGELGHCSHREDRVDDAQVSAMVARQRERRAAYLAEVGRTEVE